MMRLLCVLAGAETETDSLSTFQTLGLNLIARYVRDCLLLRVKTLAQL